MYFSPPPQSCWEASLPQSGPPQRANQGAEAAARRHHEPSGRNSIAAVYCCYFSVLLYWWVAFFFFLFLSFLMCNMVVRKKFWVWSFRNFFQTTILHIKKLRKWTKKKDLSVQKNSNKHQQEMNCNRRKTTVQWPNHDKTGHAKQTITPVYISLKINHQ